MKLIQFNAEYAPVVYRWYHDKRLAAFFRGYVGGMSMAQAAQATQFLRSHILIGLNDEDVPVGMVTFADSDPILRTYRAGLLTDPDHQHSKCALQIGRAGCAWAFEVMNAHRIYAEVMADDERLIKGLKLTGMIEEGRQRESCYFEGKLHDEVLLGMLHTEWNAQNVDKAD